MSLTSVSLSLSPVNEKFKKKKEWVGYIIFKITFFCDFLYSFVISISLCSVEPLFIQQVKQIVKECLQCPRY